MDTVRERWRGCPALYLRLFRIFFKSASVYLLIGVSGRRGILQRGFGKKVFDRIILEVIHTNISVSREITRELLVFLSICLKVLSTCLLEEFAS